MHKDESSVSGTPGMQVRSIKGLLSEEVTPQSGTASTGISVRTPASTATAIMEEKKISEKESLHIRKSKEYLKMVTTDLEEYLRNLVKPVKNSSRNTAGSMRRLKAVFSKSIETPKVDSQIGQDGEIFPPSPSKTGVFISRFSFFFFPFFRFH